MKLRRFKRSAISATVALGVILAAFSTTGRAVGLAGKNPKPVALTDEQIPAALLALDDFPAGWSTAPLPQVQAAICNGPSALARAQQENLIGHGSIRFTSNPNQGPYVDDLLYSFPSDSRARAFVKATNAQASSCTGSWQLPTIPGQPADATYRASIAGLAFPKLVGDQVLALRKFVTAQLNGQDVSTLTMDEVLVRKGNHALFVDYFASTPDVNQLQTYVRKAYSRFTTALKNAHPRATKKAS